MLSTHSIIIIIIIIFLYWFFNFKKQNYINIDIPIEKMDNVSIFDG